MDAIILAGGFGTRLKSIIGDAVPKPMADINGQPFLAIYLRYLAGQGVTRFIISLHHLGGVIKNYFGTEFCGIPIIYVEEATPLGTGGAVKLALNYCHSDQPVLISNGDSFIEFNLPVMLKLHKQTKAVLTFALAEKLDCSRYGEVVLAGDRITKFNYPGAAHQGFISTGLYIAQPDIFAGLKLSEKFSFEADFQQPRCHELYFAGYKTGGYFIDIGVPEDYEKFRQYFPTLC